MKCQNGRVSCRAKRPELLALVWLVAMMAACGERVEINESGPPASEIVEYRGARVFTGEGFVEAPLCVGGKSFVDCPQNAGSRVDLAGGFVIPPLGDAHTHHFDGPNTLPWHRQFYLDAGVFYAMTLTAPTRGVLEIRDQLKGPGNVDVATSLGGITGPDSHPAEVYEALALGIRSYEEQLARAEEIRASREWADDAYFVLETPADLEEKWPLILGNRPDVVKVYLRASERYDENYGKWGPGGGLDPELLPLVSRLADEAGLRLAVANSSLGDFRASLAAGADLVSHLPCYQDTMSDPESPYYGVDTDDDCRLSAGDAEAAAAARMGAVLIVSEWAKDRPEIYVEWEKRNTALLEEAGAPLAVGSNSYGSTVVDGLIAGAEKGFFEPARLLRLATTDTARLIFPKRRVGCFDAGCEASFVVLAGNPLESFEQIRNIRLRIKDGELLAPADTDG